MTTFSPTLHPRVRDAALLDRIVPPEQAAAFIHHGDHVGMSGFTGAGYPKLLPSALAARIEVAHACGEPFRVGVWTGASTAPELDGALARVGGIEMRMPYQSDPTCRARINAGEMEYLDIHLSHVAQFVGFGFFGKLDVAVVECAAVLDGGRLIPAASIGNNKTWLDLADKVILEVNSALPLGLEGMHDVYYGTQLPPHRIPIPVLTPSDRIGERWLRVDPRKVVAIVETNQADRNSEFAPPDAKSQRIAEHILDFFSHEVTRGRLPATLLPLQSGVGNTANAVLAGLDAGPYKDLTAYTEVLQDGMLQMLRSGTLRSASATALSLSSEAMREFQDHLDFYRDRIVLRPQEISNHPEVIRRLGIISMNGMIEADIYGNVNSTHVMGTRIMNGIGGSGDFARNAYLSIFMTASTAKNGAISCIVPMVSHVDHTEHDVQVVVTEHGLADLRGLAPRKRAQVLIDTCADPAFRPALVDYFDRALAQGRAGRAGLHTPHLLREALSWHERFEATGSMLEGERFVA